MPSANDIIATTGTTTPIAALSLVVRPGETFSAAELIVGLWELLFEAELIVGLWELLFEAGDGDVVVITVSVGNGLDVALAACINSVPYSNCIPFPSQVEKPRSRKRKLSDDA